MTDPESIQIILGKIKNAGRIYRERAAMDILKNPGLIPLLIDHALTPGRDTHIKAAYTLEIVMLQELNLLNPFIENLIPRLKNLNQESAIRPLSKILAYWVKEHLKNAQKFALSELQKAELIAVSFDWLMQCKGTAPKVFATDILFNLRKQFPWITEELVGILQKNPETQLPGFKNKAKKVCLILQRE